MLTTITAVALAATAGSVMLWRTRANARTDTLIGLALLAIPVLIVAG